MPIKSRGIIPIKGKGEMNTYWVNEEGVRASLASATETLMEEMELEPLSAPADIEAPAQAPQSFESTAPPESALPRDDEDFIRSKLEKRFAAHTSGHSNSMLSEDLTEFSA
jgi:hypothetical protein